MHTILAGIDRDAEGRRLGIWVEAAIQQIKTMAADMFGGYTSSVVEGGWVNDRGHLIEERTLRLEIAGVTDEKAIRTLAEHARGVLHQGEVMIVSSPEKLISVKDPNEDIRIRESNVA